MLSQKCFKLRKIIHSSPAERERKIRKEKGECKRKDRER
jgi:hypothetical protein